MRKPRYKYLLAALDWLTLNASFLWAYSLLGLVYPPAGQVVIMTVPEQLFFIVFSFVMIGVFKENNLYKINVFLSIADHIVRLSIALLFAVVSLAVISFFSKSAFVTSSRVLLVLYGATSLLFLIVTRVIIFRNVFLLFAKRRVFGRKAVIVGAGRTAKFLAATVRLSNPYGLRLLGFLDDEQHPDSPVFMGLKSLGVVKDGPALIKKSRVSEVIIALDDVSHSHLLEILDLYRNTRAHVKIASPLFDVVPERLFTERYGDIPVTPLASLTPNRMYLFAKRSFDITFSAIGIVLLSPVWIGIALAIKLDSPGRVFYRQVRIGKNGRPFQFYKFRSMVEGTDRESSRTAKVTAFMQTKGKANGSTKIVDEGKITRVGRFIRKSSLDELPQLVNVLRGEMSLVGPRPCLPYEWEHYENWHRRRLSIIPGCTGVWQVNGRSEVSFDEMVILDLYYISNASLLLDLVLILKTFPVMLFGRGAK